MLNSYIKIINMYINYRFFFKIKYDYLNAPTIFYE